MNEADTGRTYVLPKLKSAGWEDEYATEQLVLTPGRIVPIRNRQTSILSLPMILPLFNEQPRIVAYPDSVQARLASLRELQSATGELLNSMEL